MLTALHAVGTPDLPETARFYGELAASIQHEQPVEQQVHRTHTETVPSHYTSHYSASQYASHYTEEAQGCDWALHFVCSGGVDIAAGWWR